MVGFIQVLINEIVWYLQGDCGLTTYAIARVVDMRQETINNLIGGKGSLASADLFVSRAMVAYPAAVDDIMRRSRQTFAFGAKEDKADKD